MKRFLVLLLLPLLVGGCVDEHVVRPVFVDPTPVPGPYVPLDPVTPFPDPVQPPPVDPNPSLGDIAAALKDFEARYKTEDISEVDVTTRVGAPWRTLVSHVDQTTAWLYRVQINGETRDAELKFRNRKLVSVVLGW